MERSETIDAFAKAMAGVQATIGGAVKSSTNPHFKSKYADLSAVWEAWQAVGPKAGFSIMQFPGAYDAQERTMAMEQIVMHESGQFIATSLSIPLSKTDAQAYGSATTYARRYALGAAVGICPEDDDGNAASAGQQARQKAQQVPTISDDQVAELDQLVRDSKSDMKKFCSYYRVDSLPELPANAFGHAKAALLKKIQPEKEAA
ncbi:ERF family protein [Novosphingopyxis sp. YJ-S2-01]|nr:ERF family protein [Novosphingopyxis sp. YJ-S2-01]